MAQVHLCLASQNMELLALQNIRREAPEFFCGFSGSEIDFLH